MSKLSKINIKNAPQQTLTLDDINQLMSIADSGVELSFENTSLKVTGDTWMSEYLAKAKELLDCSDITFTGTLLNFSDFAVQTIDEDYDNYNPAVGIILNNNSIGTLLDSSDSTKGWYLTKTSAQAVTTINDWFTSKTSVTDDDNICTQNIGGSFDFTSFEELQYFTNITYLIGGQLYNSNRTGAFYNCTNLRTIKIPSKVTQLGNYGHYHERGCFQGCTNLELNLDTDLPSGLTYLGYMAFAYCRKITGTNINVNKVGIGALGGCYGITEMTINNATLDGTADGNVGNDTGLLAYNPYLTKVDISTCTYPNGRGYFQNCTALTDVKLSNTVSMIPLQMFQGCTSIKTLNIPDCVTSIGDNAFYGSKLESISNENITYIGIASFGSCASLKTVYLPKVTYINYANSNSSGAFSHCIGITSLTLGVLTNVAKGAFSNCALSSTVMNNIKQCIVNANFGAGAFVNSGLTGVLELDNPNFNFGNGSYYDWGYQNQIFDSSVILHIISSSGNVPSLINTNVLSQSSVIYIGDGSSLEHDTAVLEGGTYDGVEYTGYANATNWSTLYTAGRLKTWYEYLNPTE